MEYNNEKYNDVANIVKTVAEESNVSEVEVINAVKKILEIYEKGE